jgi:hypothetical protein
MVLFAFDRWRNLPTPWHRNPSVEYSYKHGAKWVWFGRIRMTLRLTVGPEGALGNLAPAFDTGAGSTCLKLQLELTSRKRDKSV